MQRVMSYEMTSLADPAPGFDDVIDVRSPSEFAEDHVPGAINLAVLDDEERARVGTIYVQDDSFLARKIGAALVARNAARHIEGPLADRGGGWKPLVYCWRGGQRSGSFTSILAQIGWRAETLEGGYRSYRRLVAKHLYENDFPSEVVLLDGNTGTAKTEVLQLLQQRGVQTIDLEGMANHRGSALGAQGDQPSQKAFESTLAARVARLDPARPVVIEAESSKIGAINVPSRVFEAMKSARRLQIAAPVAARADYLTRTYRDLTSDYAALASRLDRLVRLQGRDKVARWKAMAKGGAFQDLAAELIQDHYDPRYQKVRTRRETEAAVMVETEGLGPDHLETLADRIASKVSARSG